MEHLAKEVNRAAQTAGKWFDVVDEDDIRQELWFRLCESEAYTARIEAMGPEDRYGALVQMAHNIAAGETTARDRAQNPAHYSGRDIRDAISSKSTLGGVDEESLRRGIEALANSRKSYQRRYAEVLHKRLVLGQEWFSRVEAQRYQRAIKALTAEINRAWDQTVRDHEGPGSRKVISNYTAQEITRWQRGG